MPGLLPRDDDDSRPPKRPPSQRVWADPPSPSPWFVYSLHVRRLGLESGSGPPPPSLYQLYVPPPSAHRAGDGGGKRGFDWYIPFPPPAYPFFPSHVNPREATASRGILLRTWYPFQPGSLAVFPPMASEILGHRRHIARAQRAIVFATAFTLLGPRTYHHSVTPSGTAYPGPSVTWEGQATYEKRARCELQRRSHAGGVAVVDLVVVVVVGGGGGGDVVVITRVPPWTPAKTPFLLSQNTVRALYRFLVYILLPLLPLRCFFPPLLECPLVGDMRASEARPAPHAPPPPPPPPPPVPGSSPMMQDRQTGESEGGPPIFSMMTPHLALAPFPPGRRQGEEGGRASRAPRNKTERGRACVCPAGGHFRCVPGVELRTSP
ncbi:hypothetical protein Purlil1_5864 [Purpureocillium lilacinum]|uniref:Uncharacterized protein n=1 Tax=Purpureocillium lilacinum TaxID=33203 RepID=A0ABR0C161_PURLI|nr:hypothetical protein Purlil1_5864 [Purpureocillium lilacinum]